MGKKKISRGPGGKCEFCGKVCKDRVGLSRHTNVCPHRTEPEPSAMDMVQGVLGRMAQAKPKKSKAKAKAKAKNNGRAAALSATTANTPPALQLSFNAGDSPCASLEAQIAKMTANRAVAIRLLGMATQLLHEMTETS